MLKQPFQRGLSRTFLFIVIALALYIPAKWAVLHVQPVADLTVGSKNFTESRILAEMYSLALEKAGYRVQRRFDLGGTLIAHAALRKGEIDVYPEYTGTGLLNILNLQPEKNEQTVFATLNREYRQRWSLSWLKPAQANDSQGLVVTRKTAYQHQVYTISQLAKLAPRFRLAVIPEFIEREDGLKGLQKVYGTLAFKEIRQYDNGLKYRVLLGNHADVTIGFTTDGELTDPRLILLEDDRSFWPLYRVAPVIREKTLKAYPLAEGALDKISSLIDTKTLRQLNAEVDLQKKDYHEVARAFLKNRRAI